MCREGNGFPIQKDKNSLSFIILLIYAKEGEESMWYAE